MLSTENNPWIGLESYSINDAYRFYGRDCDIELVSNAIYDNFITTIYGISGAGKTSLLNAGLTPALIAENYLPIRVRLIHNTDKSYSTQIIEAVSNAIESIGGEIEYEGAISLDKIVEHEKLWFFLHTRRFWSKHNYSIRPVIFIDQFEELFTKNDDAYKISLFFEMINAIQYDTPPSNTKDLLENGTDYFELECNTSRIVFVIREDFLARLEDYSYGIAALRRNRIGIKQMNGHQALEVILNPNPSLITREGALKILSKVSGKEVIDSDRSLGRLSVDTSILSLFCSELYQRAVEENSDTITTNIIEEFGSNIISHFYTKCMSQVPSSLVTYLEKHLLTSNGFRNSIALEDIEIPKFTKESINNSLLLLSDKRIIRIEDTNGVERVEFTHDVLCKVAKQHRDNINKSKELKRNRWTSVLKSLDFLIILLLTYLSLKNGDYIFNGQVGTLRLLRPKFIAICTLFFYSFLSKRRVVNPRGCLVFSILLGVVLVDLPYTPTSLGYADFIDNITNLTIPLLTIPLSFFAFRKEAQGNKKLFLALLTIDVLLIAFQYSNSISGLLILFSSLVLLPYRYSNDKKSYIFACIASLLNIIYFLINIHGTIDNLLLSFACILYPLTTFVFKPKDSTKTFHSSLTSCLTLEVFKTHKYLKTILLIFAVLYLIVINIKDGYFVSEYNISDSAYVSGLVFALLVSILTLISSKFRVFITDKSDFVFWGGVISSIVTILIFSCLYIPYGFFIVLCFWGAISILIYKLYKQSTCQNKKNNHILLVLISLISIVYIPLNGIGYNISSHVQYARVHGSLKYAYDFANELILIKDVHGNYGIRDRFKVIVPVKYDGIVSISSDGIDTYYRYGLFNYDYSSNIGSSHKYFPRIDVILRRLSRWKKAEDIHTRFYDKNNSKIPNIRFEIQQGDTTFTWDCNQHLNDNNLCTSLIKYSAEAKIKGSLDILAAQEYLSANDNSEEYNSDIAKTQFLYCFKHHLYREFEFNSLEELKYNLMQHTKLPESTKQNLRLAINNSYQLLPFVEDSSYVKLILDTLCNYTAPRSNKSYDKWEHYTNIAKYHLYAKQFDKAEEYARKALEIDSTLKLAYVPLIESYIARKQYCEAKDILDLYANKMFYQGKIYREITDTEERIIYEYSDSCSTLLRYNSLNNALANDIPKLEEYGVISDQDDFEYTKFKQRISSSHLVYDSAEDRGEYYICRKYDSYIDAEGEFYRNAYYNDFYQANNTLLYQFYMVDDNQLAGFKHYSTGIDDDILLIIDELDKKRKYINRIGGKPFLITGEFDHGWRFSEGKAAVSLNGKLGFINQNGDYVIDSIFVFSHERCARTDKYNRKITDFVDFTFHNGLCPMINENGKYGIIDTTGKWVIEGIYDRIVYLEQCQLWITINYEYDGYEKTLKCGAVDKSGRILLETKYVKFLLIEDSIACWGDENSHYVVVEGLSQKPISRFEIVEFGADTIAKGRWYYITPDGDSRYFNSWEVNDKILNRNNYYENL